MNDCISSAGSDIDRVLTDFFQREQPHPWPRIAPPQKTFAEVRDSRLPRRSLRPARFVLAASVAVLTITGLWLAARMPAPTTRPVPSLDSGTANVPANLQLKNKN